MEGFTKLPKMQHFKEGGSVQKQIADYEKRERKTEESADIAQDKVVVKKAIKMHDVQEHEGEKTDLSKLKKGGRAKKELGTARKFIKPAAAPSGAKGGPNKYKVGGTVTNVYEAKKKSGDIDAIEAVKDIKPGKAAAPSKAAVISKNTPAKFCGGKSVKKMADGGGVLGAIGQGATSLKEKIMGTPEQNRLALEREKRIREREAAMKSGNPTAIAAQPAPTAPLPGPTSAAPMIPPPPGINAGAGAPAGGAQAPAIPGGMKKGGKAKGKC